MSSLFSGWKSQHILKQVLMRGEGMSLEAVTLESGSICFNLVSNAITESWNWVFVVFCSVDVLLCISVVPFWWTWTSSAVDQWLALLNCAGSLFLFGPPSGGVYFMTLCNGMLVNVREYICLILFVKYVSLKFYFGNNSLWKFGPKNSIRK